MPARHPPPPSRRAGLQRRRASAWLCPRLPVDKECCCGPACVRLAQVTFGEATAFLALSGLLLEYAVGMAVVARWVNHREASPVAGAPRPRQRCFWCAQHAGRPACGLAALACPAALVG